MADNQLSDLSYEELMEKVRQIRQGRVTPTKKKVVKRKSTERARKSRTNKFLDGLDEETKKKILAKIKQQEQD